jgi:pentatricopeptide repeat protein
MSELLMQVIKHLAERGDIDLAPRLMNMMPVSGREK